MAERPVLTLAPVTAPIQAPPELSQAAPSAPSAPTEARVGEPSVQPDPEAQSKASRQRSLRRATSAPAKSKPASPAASADSAPWRTWGRFHQTVSFKWPPELADELDNRRHDLREPVGLMVVAAITHLLDQDDDTIRRLIDRVEQAKPRSGRSRHDTA
jgi:hypothetical protein